MKRFIYFALLLLIFMFVLIFREDVNKLYYKMVKYFSPIDLTLEKNQYYREYDFNYVQNTIDFSPSNMQDVINIFYTVINSGQETFSFYCPDEYITCTNDIKTLANDQTMLSHINNFVHPYNGFKHIETQYNSLGEVTITVFKNYDKEKIAAIESRVNEVIATKISPSYTDIEKIRVAHDFIINNARYDTERSEHNVYAYDSDTAYGPLLQGYGICGGYSDAMQIFLEKFGIKSYKIASASHIWNAVYLDGYWYHLDLTWDDPITSDGRQILDDDFFLISSNQLKSRGSNEHGFDTNIYSEVR